MLKVRLSCNSSVSADALHQMKDGDSLHPSLHLQDITRRFPYHV